nr:MAG: replication initiation protein [Microvirus Sku18]
MKKYPFVKCLHPKKIRNPYTKEYIVAPCGHCKACLLRKSGRNSLLCDLESKSNRYCYFITLTYSDKFVPRMTTYHFDDVCYCYDKETGELLHIQDMDANTYYKMLNKFHLSYDIPVLRKKDLQGFIKRLRRRLEYNYGEKVRFFGVGEYGPKHFRPHYHLLLWSKEPFYRSEMADLVSKCWRFGRTDCQLTTGKASHYVAGYTSSFSFIPSILKDSKVSPFCTHSQRLGSENILLLHKEMYELPAKQVVERSSVIGGKYKEYNLWKSCISFFYPRCRKYADITSHERYTSYTLYEKGVKIFGNWYNSSDLAKLCYDVVHNKLFPPGYTPSDSNFWNYLDRLYYDCADLYYRKKDSGYEVLPFEEVILSAFYRAFYCSYSFYRICDVLGFDKHYFLRKIECFYSEYDYYNLKRNYENMELYSKSDLFTESDLDLFYDNINTSSRIINTRLYSRYVSDVHDNYSRSVKHKLHNDINKLLCDF